MLVQPRYRVARRELCSSGSIYHVLVGLDEREEGRFLSRILLARRRLVRRLLYTLMHMQRGAVTHTEVFQSVSERSSSSASDDEECAVAAALEFLIHRPLYFGFWTRRPFIALVARS